MSHLINMTPHPINICDAEGVIIKVIPASGNLIRLAQFTVPQTFTVDDIPVTKSTYSEPNGLPEYELGTFYIVSQLVKTACPDREDLLVPAEVVRDSSGNIIGCRSLGI